MQQAQHTVREEEEILEIFGTDPAAGIKNSTLLGPIFSDRINSESYERFLS